MVRNVLQAADTYLKKTTTYFYATRFTESVTRFEVISHLFTCSAT